MTTIKGMNEDFEEIYLERARYLLSADDLLEQILSEQILEQTFSERILENNINPTSANLQVLEMLT